MTTINRAVATIRPARQISNGARTNYWIGHSTDGLRSVLQELHPTTVCHRCSRMPYDRVDNASDRAVFDPSCVIERGSLRIGIIGIASNIVDKSMPPSYSEGVRFTLGNTELPGHIERLRSVDKVDLVLVLSHLGFAQTPSSSLRFQESTRSSAATRTTGSTARSGWAARRSCGARRGRHPRRAS